MNCRCGVLKFRKNPYKKTGLEVIEVIFALNHHMFACMHVCVCVSVCVLSCALTPCVSYMCVCIQVLALRFCIIILASLLTIGQFANIVLLHCPVACSLELSQESPLFDYDCDTGLAAS